MAIGRVNTGGGGSGGTLTVTGVSGHTVTATKEGKTYTRTFNSSGVTVFMGLATGTWTLTMTGDGQTATRTVTVNADYDVTITYFSATINITYPAGSTCKATHTDGTVLNAPDTSGTWACVVPKSGTWTILAEDTSAGKSKSVDVSITADGQSESVTLTYELVLFDGGDVSAITGGWESSGTGGSASVGTIISMSVTDSTGYAKLRTLTTKNSIDLTGFNLLVASIKSVSGGGEMRAGDSAKVTISETGNVSLDISEISSEQKISFEIVAWKSSTSLKVDRVWLE